MYKHANLIVATTPIGEKLSRETRVEQAHHRSSDTSATAISLTVEGMMEDWQGRRTIYPRRLRAAKGRSHRPADPAAIIAQIMQIQSRMPHQNIPQKYLDDLHTLLYADDYDEDAINEELRKLKLDRLCRLRIPGDDRQNGTYRGIHAAACQEKQEEQGDSEVREVRS